MHGEKVEAASHRKSMHEGHRNEGSRASYTVPIPKCDGRTRALSVDDFRGISISPVISKLFEMAILDRFASYFLSSDHQFGFKRNSSCRHAIYCVRSRVCNTVFMEPENLGNPAFFQTRNQGLNGVPNPSFRVWFSHFQCVISALFVPLF